LGSDDEKLLLDLMLKIALEQPWQFYRNLKWRVLFCRWCRTKMGLYFPEMSWRTGASSVMITVLTTPKYGCMCFGFEHLDRRVLSSSANPCLFSRQDCTGGKQSVQIDRQGKECLWEAVGDWRWRRDLPVSEFFAGCMWCMWKKPGRVWELSSCSFLISLTLSQVHSTEQRSVFWVVWGLRTEYLGHGTWIQITRSRRG
jgi:hypothetical protein